MNENNIILSGYENTELLGCYQTDKLPETYCYDDLPNYSLDGVLKSNRYIDGKLMQTYTGHGSHVGVIAATRLGKTTSYVIPTVLSFVKQKTKKSMLITDPKGEIYRYTAATLKEQGYTVKLINFRDYRRSECWNPMTHIFRIYQRAQNIYSEVGLIMVDGRPRNTFRGKVYEDQAELTNEIENERNLLLNEAENEIDIFSRMIIDTVSTRDPTWEDGARDFFRAHIYAMLEDTQLKDNPITEDTFSLNTIFRVVDTFRNTSSGYEDGGYFSSRSKDSKAYNLAKNIILDTASATRSSYISVFVTKLTEYREVTTRMITSCNSFELEKLICSGPVAIFIDFHDELDSQYDTITLFVQDVYKTLVEVARRSENGKLDAPWYFILDEFGNFTRLKNFDKTISACAGRNIYFIIIIQSYAQLDNVYGAETAKIIRDNLNIHVFFGSNNPGTIDEFSRECGEYTRISPLSAMNGKGADIEHYEIETIPRVTKSWLRKLAPGECIVTEANCGYVLFSRLERYYNCAEFNNLPLSRESDYIPTVNPLDSRYNYTYEPNNKDFDW